MYQPKTALGQAWLEIAGEVCAIFEAKQHDYGPRNIAAFGEKGCLVRAYDKVVRLMRLVWDGRTPANEAIEDTWLDLADYAIIALLVRRGLWPKEEH